MKKLSDQRQEREKLRQSIIGLGERSIRKSYYPELQQRIADLERSNLELQAEIKEKLAAQESAKNLTRQLQQAQKMEAIGTLAGGVAHDFNNILSAIIGYSELAQLHLARHCQDLDCPVGHDLEMVLQAAGRARELVRQILTFSRTQDYQRVALQLGPVIDTAIALLRSSLPRSVEITTGLEIPEALVLANETQLHQIIMNLGTNAYHAMGEAGGVLAIDLKRVEIDLFDEKSHSLQLAPGKYLLLQICDNGCGMERRIVDKIFEPYFTTKPKERGTGLGLAVVHGIVKSHDGHISVYSEPGKGTSFQIYLPELVGQPEENRLQEINDIPLGQESILVVDDEAVVAVLHQRILESLGYSVEICTTPEKALALLTADPLAYDLLLTDMTMPKMNGAMLTQAVLKIRPTLPVILCTGFSELINEQKAQAIGVRAFAMKPLVRKSIATTIRQALQGDGVSLTT
ncbi:MAG: ATP-binding protein [Desulforhopalus sp.]|jgi:signal transduction histidine kinase/ActR/RegA family two-component response regulator|nr:ATP-binding protein [Desulforhopalus sp.]